MTRDEIRGLIGGYATGSLTEEERGILFNAALEDQELFDELAREQALRDAIEQPGGRERLLRALQPRHRWRPMWVWAAAAAAAVAVVSGIIVMRSVPQPQQIARVEVPPPPPIQAPEPAPPAEPPAATPAAAPQPLPKTAPAKEIAPPAPVAGAGAVREATEAPAVPAPEKPPLPPPPKAEAPAPKQESAAATGTVAGTISPTPAGVGGAVAEARGGRGGRAAVRDEAGGGGGGGLRANRALVAPLAAQAPAPPRFSFDYSVTPEGLLRITPAANGFLSVSSDNGTSVSDVLSSRQVQTGSFTELRLPANTVTAIVLFSARARTYLAGDFAPSQDPSSGTKSDPNPSPDSVLVAHIRLKP